MRIEVTIGATPDRVFLALTERAELESWWAKKVVAEPKVGAVLEATFHVGSDHEWVIEMELSVLEPSREVRWISRRGPPAWSGTTVAWILTRTEQGTSVLFEQRGFDPSAVLPDGTFPGFGGWQYYIASLKDYLETGKGRPGGFMVRR